MEVVVVPFRQQLDDAMQIGDRRLIRQPRPPPNRGMDALQQGLQLQPMRRTLSAIRLTIEIVAAELAPDL